ncbi:hypothetical protein [Streptomyces yanii]|uniref:HEAT repeat domain-containing protein n=1 Tax=Streptomyces yanii TaxID=78510 RepID=A0ABV5RQM0_9ACTN
MAALGSSHDEPVTDLLVARTDDTDRRVRFQVAWSLARRPDPLVRRARTARGGPGRGCPRRRTRGPGTADQISLTRHRPLLPRNSRSALRSAGQRRLFRGDPMSARTAGCR